jgi:hypothetical protein
MPDPRLFAPATARNRDAIRDVLGRFVRDGDHVLEIASGTGEHATYLAQRLPIASWQPTDGDRASCASIDAWTHHLAADRVRPAITLDGAASALRAASIPGATGGLLYLYGPYRRAGAHTAPSNAAFDASLRARDPAWGVRDLDTVVAEGAARGFTLEDVVEMPANNLSVVLRALPP